MSHTFFITYSSQDSLVAQEVLLRLRSEEFKPYVEEVFIDQEILQLNDYWLFQLHEKIRQVDTLIFLLSARSIDSRPCHEEFNYALEHGKQLLFINVDDSDLSNKIPEYWHDIEWSYLVEKGLKKPFHERILDALKNQPNKPFFQLDPKVHDPLVIGAINAYERALEMVEKSLLWLNNINLGNNAVHLRRTFMHLATLAAVIADHDALTVHIQHISYFMYNFEDNKKALESCENAIERVEELRKKRHKSNNASNTMLS